jgi:hypothetical protein
MMQGIHFTPEVFFPQNIKAQSNDKKTSGRPKLRNILLKT